MTTISAYLRGRGWTVRGTPVRGASGSFTPRFVMVHHYAGAEDPARAPGEAAAARTSFDHSPIYHLYVGTDGSLHTITDGRANHAGRGGMPALGIPTDQGNALSIGISGQCNGAHPLATHPAGYDVLVRVVADLCRMLGVSSANVIGHREYTTRKIDPRDNMDTIRRDVQRHLDGSTPPDPAPTPTPEVPGMLIQAPTRSWWLLSGERLVSITAQAAQNGRAGGLPAWAADSASWTNLVAAYVPTAQRSTMLAEAVELDDLPEPVAGE